MTEKAGWPESPANIQTKPASVLPKERQNSENPTETSSFLLESSLRVRERTQEVKVLLDLPGDLHLISRDPMIEG